MSIFLGICSATGYLSAETARSIYSFQTYAYRFGCKTDLTIQSGADVAVARNILATRFLASECEYFVGLDDDTGFKTSVLHTLHQSVLKNASVACFAISPQRTLNLPRFADAIRAGKTDAQAVLAASPPVGLPPDQPTGFFSPKTIEFGCGLYCVSKVAFKRMIDLSDVPKIKIRGANSEFEAHGFYNPVTDSVGRYWAEDKAFIERLRNAGIQVQAYYGSGVTHSGLMTFST